MLWPSFACLPASIKSNGIIPSEKKIQDKKEYDNCSAMNVWFYIFRLECVKYHKIKLFKETRFNSMVLIFSPIAYKAHLQPPEPTCEHHLAITCISPLFSRCRCLFIVSLYFICSFKVQIEFSPHWTLQFKITARDLQVMGHKTHLIFTKGGLRLLNSVTFRETSVSYEPVKSAYICK